MYGDKAPDTILKPFRLDIVVEISCKPGSCSRRDAPLKVRSAVVRSLASSRSGITLATALVEKKKNKDKIINGSANGSNDSLNRVIQPS